MLKRKNIIFLFDFVFASIMNMATASGRNLFPDNFAREVFPHFNLPPLHSLMEKFIQEMVLQEVKKKNKEYIGRGEGIPQQMLSYLQALVILEVKSMQSLMLYTDIVTFIDRIDCFRFI